MTLLSASKQGHFLLVRKEEIVALVNSNTGQEIATDVRLANTFWKRLKGLMFTESLPAGQALCIYPCSSIHTYFMKYPIDILYVSDEGTILGYEQGLQPGRIGKKVSGTQSVIELPPKTIEQSGTKIGHKLQMSMEQQKTKIIREVISC